MNDGFKELFLAVDMFILVFVTTFSGMAAPKQTTFGDQDPDEGMHLLMHFSNS